MSILSDGFGWSRISCGIHPSISRYLPVGEALPVRGRGFHRDLCRNSMKSERDSRRVGVSEAYSVLGALLSIRLQHGVGVGRG